MPKPSIRFLLVPYAIALVVLCSRYVHAEARRSVARVSPILKTLTQAGYLDRSTHLHLALGLPLRNQDQLNQLLVDLYDPASPLFHQYLTPEQFAERFGPTEGDYQAVIDFVQKHGLIVRGRHGNRVVLEVEGEVAALEAMLNIRFGLYQHPRERRVFYSPTSDPLIPSDVPVQDIQGLDNYLVPRPMSLKRSEPSPQLTGSAPDGSYRGYDFRAAYAPNVRLNGTGQIVGLLEFDGYYTNDIALYERDTGIRNVPLQNILLDGVNGAAKAGNTEVALDIESCISMAPGLTKVIVYEGASGNTILSRIASDNVAKQLSSSWTYGVNSTTEQLFSQLAAQGQTMFQASGDDDAYINEIPTPSDNPNITIVGGTTLTTSGPGGVWLSETTWNWTGTDNGTGGGVSFIFPIPSWQKGISMSANLGSTAYRNLPDVALTADHVWVRDNNGSSEAVGGTSVSAPLWAGYMALINQQAKSFGRATIGFFNPSLYPLGKGAKYGASFHDITTGNNTSSSSPNKYYAVSGYDLCTGWGTPAGQPFINALTGVTNVAPAFMANSFTEPNANSGRPYSASIAAKATDPDPGDKLTFSKTSGPAWLTVGSNGLLAGTPGNANFGTNSFGIKVTDSGGLSASATMIIVVLGAPSFLSNPFSEPTANVGTPYTGNISTRASDPNAGAILSFAKINGPTWLSIASNGSLSGTPASIDAGTNSFAVSVQDSLGSSNTATMYLLVNGAPYFFASALLEPQASVAQPYSASIAKQAFDPNTGDTLTFSKLNGASWLGVTANGALSGTPAFSDVGTNIFGVRVTDQGGLSGDAQLFVDVVAPTPVTLQIAFQQDHVLLTWTGGGGQYQLQATSGLTQSNWVNVGPSINVQSLVLPLTNSTVFYRVESQ